MIGAGQQARRNEPAFQPRLGRLTLAQGLRHHRAIEQRTAQTAVAFAGGKRNQAQFGQFVPARPVNRAGQAARGMARCYVGRPAKPLDRGAEQFLIFVEVEIHAILSNVIGALSNPRSNMLGATLSSAPAASWILSIRSRMLVKATVISLRLSMLPTHI